MVEKLPPSLRSFKIVCAYLGTYYFGWQETKEGPSVENAIVKALEQVLRHKIELQAASRTDRGVHAEAQVIQFYTSRDDICTNKLRYALQGLLSPYIAIRLIEEMPVSFHPTLDVQSKEYRYYLCLNRVQLPFFRDISWHMPGLLHLDAMREGMKQLTGCHDFRAFCNHRKTLRYTDYTRTIFRLYDQPLPHNRLCIVIQGDHFLYKMVRNMVGTLAQIGKGTFSLDSLSDKLLSKDRKEMGVTAPAHGLFLHSVNYTH